MPSEKTGIVYIYRGPADKAPWNDIRQGLAQRLGGNVVLELTIACDVIDASAPLCSVSQGHKMHANDDLAALVKSPTIHDVAREARVSMKTVSRVLNNCLSVDAERRARVLSAVEKISYRPNLAARAMGLARKTRNGKLSDAEKLLSALAPEILKS